MMQPLISIVTPVHNEELNIPLFYDAIRKVIRKLPYRFELIFVDDGSTDHSILAIEGLKKSKLAVRLIELSRNFGKEIAITAGLTSATGDAALLIDSDLQHPVEEIPQFLNHWENGNEVVIGVRKSHGSHNWIKNQGSNLFYKIMNYISETKTVPHATDYRLVDRRVIDAFSRFTERQRLTRGLIDWLGFTREYVHFDANERQFGTASYNLIKLFRLAINSFTSHSLFPLKLAGYLGTIITLGAGLIGAFIIIEFYLLKDPMHFGFTGTGMLAVMLLFLIGVVLMCLGLIALYIANIHGEVINRPLYVVRQEKEL